MYKGFAEHFRVVAICRCWGVTPQNKSQKKSYSNSGDSDHGQERITVELFFKPCQKKEKGSAKDYNLGPDGRPLQVVKIY